MDLRIRRLGRQEAHLAEPVVRAFKGASRASDSLREFLANPANYLLIAETGCEVCGFLMAYRLDRPDREESQMFVYEVSVGVPWRGRGVATALVEKITAMARAERMFEAFVLTSQANERAKGLYARTGGVVEDDAAVLFVYPLDSGPPDSRRKGRRRARVGR